MRKRPNPGALAKIASIRNAQRAQAEYALMRADAAEREAQNTVREADGRREAAVSEWHDHLAGQAFVPELAQALAGQLLGRVEASLHAAERAKDMTEQRSACQADWLASDVRLRQAQEVLDGSRRACARQRDERAVDALADSITFRWSRT